MYNLVEEELHKVRQEMIKVSEGIADTKSKLKAMYKVIHELRKKLDYYDSEKSRIGSAIENATRLKAEILREIEISKRHRDEVREKIELCTKAGCRSALSSGYREFNEGEILDATDRFSEKLIVSSPGGDGIVYKGRLDHIDVAIKFKASFCMQSSEDFNLQVELLRQLRHPHIVSTVGASTGCKCIVFEYLHGGTLKNSLFAGQTQSKKKQACLLPWHTRIRIALEVCSAVGFLNSGRPQPVSGVHIDPSHVFLDHNLVAKISVPFHRSGLVLGFYVVSLGNLILQLLTGKEAVTAEEVQGYMGNLKAHLDPTAGEWPMEIAEEFAEIGVRYGAKEPDASHSREDILSISRELEILEMKAKKIRMRRPEEVVPELKELPTAFLCPIFQEVMKEPYVAADGFSYELDAIKGWIDGGHETSPMTNLKLINNRLTPNHTLRSFIDDWRSSRSIIHS